jgi:hypothetical protein
MCFDTTGVVEKDSPLEDAEGFYMEESPSGWYWFPKRVYEPYYWWNIRKTAYFYARDKGTGEIVTDFLPAHIRTRLVDGKYFRFRQRDRPDDELSGWLKVPSNVTVYGRYDTGTWEADDFYWVVDDCDYAISTNPVQPLQSTMDAACAFVDLLDADDDKAGLATYAWGATLDQQLTPSWESLQEALQSFEPSGATAEADGMKVAIDELALSGRAEGFGHKIMILLTDGKANVRDGEYYAGTESYEFLGQWVEDCEITEYVARALEEQAIRAKEESIRIYCVSFGEGADTKLQSIIASETNGAYYYAPSHEILTEVFIDIFRRLPPILTF